MISMYILSSLFEKKDSHITFWKKVTPSKTMGRFSKKKKNQKIKNIKRSHFSKNYCITFEVLLFYDCGH